ncbi:MAG: crossover junction endodeoxyribonuclease RuvC, partial [Planctomycetales bacterium]|nr:crossover junction endodeoxyribonuclease RuvC [Planctomycetales bacterium]
MESMTGNVTRVLGVDPGLNTTGYGVIDVVGGKVRLVEAGVIRSTAKLTLPERLQELFD